MPATIRHMTRRIKSHSVTLASHSYIGDRTTKNKLDEHTRIKKCWKGCASATFKASILTFKISQLESYLPMVSHIYATAPWCDNYRVPM